MNKYSIKEKINFLLDGNVKNLLSRTEMKRFNQEYFNSEYNLMLSIKLFFMSVYLIFLFLITVVLAVYKYGEFAVSQYIATRLIEISIISWGMVIFFLITLALMGYYSVKKTYYELPINYHISILLEELVRIKNCQRGFIKYRTAFRKEMDILNEIKIVYKKVSEIATKFHFVKPTKEEKRIINDFFGFILYELKTFMLHSSKKEFLKIRHCLNEMIDIFNKTEYDRLRLLLPKIKNILEKSHEYKLMKKERHVFGRIQDALIKLIMFMTKEENVIKSERLYKFVRNILLLIIIIAIVLLNFDSLIEVMKLVR